jgi:uncharacterized membrane protein YcaP (DUF421 family)
MDNLFFDNWDKLLRTAVIGVLAYVLLVLFLRISGKRTLSKMNAFDLVVTVALGSTLATILLSKDVTLAQGSLALLMLIGMQFVVTWSSVRSRRLRAFVTGEPTMLLYRGQTLSQAMRTARVTEDELHAALRGAGVASLQHVEAVVLETDGSINVVQRSDDDGAEVAPTLKRVPGYRSAST